MKKSLCGANCAECPSKEACFGVIARESFILICTYHENGTEPELILYKHR